jgi:hypothetical protein
VTSKSPVGDISVVTLIRTDTTLDHSQKAEKVCMQMFPPWSIQSESFNPSVSINHFAPQQPVHISEPAGISNRSSAQ